MFCGSCGVHQAGTGAFCGSCGANLAAVPAQAPASETSVAAATTEAAVGRGRTTGEAPSQPTGYGPTPSAAPSVPWSPPAAPRVDNTLAWTLAFAPLIFVLLDGILLSAGADEAFAAISLLVAVGINCLLSWADARRLRAAGYDLSVGLAVFLVPIYLFKRATLLGQKLAIPVVWCLCFLASFAGAGVVGNTLGVPIDTPAVEAEIRDGLLEQAGLVVMVECPSSVSPKPGSSFQCFVEGAGQRAMVDVTVQNTKGDIVWQVR